MSLILYAEHEFNASTFTSRVIAGTASDMYSCITGAIGALREKGLQVPGDVSVVGFDDIQSAAFQNPALTTVRQPLRKMGMIAAETVLRRIARPGLDRL